MRRILFICILFLTACASSSNHAVPADPLLAYYTITPASTNTPDVFIPETPIPTATPFTYMIQQGDTLSELAEKFNLSQDDLQALNPEVDPKSMTIGMTILIPGSPLAAAGSSTPTPVPVPVTQTACHATADNGLWCFALIHNNTNDILENVSVQITLIGRGGAPIASQLAGLPLDILPPNISLPAYVYFPNVPPAANPQVQLISALQLNTGEARYPPAFLDNSLAQIDSDGKTARLSGQIFLPAESTAATQVWVAAVAYDENGQVVGVKRWEGGAIQPGTSSSFNFSIASVGSRIDLVEFVVEARP